MNTGDPSTDAPAKPAGSGWLKRRSRCGLSPRAAIAAATSNDAEQFGWTEIGAVAVGRRADLVVLDRHPALDVRNVDDISAVYLAGSKVDRAALLKHR